MIILIVGLHATDGDARKKDVLSIGKRYSI